VIEAMARGGIAGFPVVDVRVTLHDGDFHEVDSSERAFHICASMGFKEAFRKAGPAILEPVMSVNVITPLEHLGAVNGDLAARRGRIEAMESAGTTREIRAVVPLSEMFGYITQLMTITRGEGTFTMAFDHYEPLPASLAEEIAAERAKASGRS